MVISLIEQGAHPGKLIGGVLAGVWAQQRDVSDVDTLRAIAGEQGYDADSLLESAARPEAEAACAASTQQAIDRNVFGAPTWIVDDEIFWGQDRLEFLERAITGQNGPSNG
jgi:2-hydroxychromene-2-carboxylate isomerase